MVSSRGRRVVTGGAMLESPVAQRLVPCEVLWASLVGALRRTGASTWRSPSGQQWALVWSLPEGGFWRQESRPRKRCLLVLRLPQGLWEGALGAGPESPCTETQSETYYLSPAWPGR